MKLEDLFKLIIDIVMQVLNLELPVMEYRVTFLQILIFGMLIYLISKLMFGFGSKKGATATK